MGFLFKRTLDPPVFGGLQVQVAVNAIPIPIIYGSPRVAPNLIYVNGFKATRKSSGSKGLLGGGKGSTNEVYTATLILGLGEGPIFQIIFVYQDNGVYTISSLPPGAVLNLFQGLVGQAPWSFVVSNFPADARSYPFVGYLGGPNYPLDSAATVPQFNLMVTGPYTASSPLNPINLSAFGITTGNGFAGGVYFADADPAICVYDLLTNPRYGIGFPQTLIDPSWQTSTDGTIPAIGDPNFQTYCQAVGLAFSTVLASSEQCSSIIQRWLDLLGVAAVWNGISLKFIPYWDRQETTNPGYNAAIGIPLKYYTPNVTPLFDFGDADYIQAENEDPLTIERTDQVDVLNAVRINYRDRNLQFNSNVAEAKDEAAIETTGLRADTLSGQGEFTFANYANAAANIRLARNMSVRNKYKFKLGFIWGFLDPMDIVTVSDSNLGLTRVPIRIISVEEDEKFEISIIAEEFPAGGISPTLFAVSGGTGTNVLATNAVPPSVYTPVIRQPPSGYLTNFNQTPIIQIGASGGVSGALGPNWGGCDVYLSADNVTYVLQSNARITGPTRIGTTTAALAAYAAANPDTTSTLTIDFSESGAVIASGADADAIAGRTLLWVGQELIGYTGATLVGPNKYTFTRLWRHMYGTTGAALSSGAQAMRLDGAQAEVGLPGGYSGLTVYVKLPSFNNFNSMEQSLAAATAYSFVVT